MSGDGDKGSYKRNGFDGGTRFRFAADYYLFDDISWISYYELGVNIPALFDWDNHYAEGANNTSRRMLYTGLKSDTGDVNLRSAEQRLLRRGRGKNRYLGLRHDRPGAG
jgi:predicted porin